MGDVHLNGSRRDCDAGENCMLSIHQNSHVINSDTQSSHYSGSLNGPWTKIMPLMEKMMTTMKVRSLVMVFRTSYGGGGEMRGGMAVALRGTGMDIPVGSRTEIPEHCH